MPSSTPLCVCTHTQRKLEREKKVVGNISSHKSLGNFLLQYIKQKAIQLKIHFSNTQCRRYAASPRADFINVLREHFFVQNFGAKKVKLKAQLLNF